MRRHYADSLVSETYVIVGAALAGAKAAETLREEGFDGRVVLLGDEPDRPYERPPLSKDYLRGETEREGPYAHPASFYGEKDIELRLETTVTGLDLAAGQLLIGKSGWRIRSCCLPPAQSRVGCLCRAPTSTESTTCAPSATAMRCARRSRRAAAWP